MKAHLLKAALQSEGGQSVEGNRTGKFWDLHPFDGGSAWIGRWQGESPWERHAKGDEFLHVMEGEVEVVVLTSKGKVSTKVSKGSIFIVPKNHWHKQIAQSEVVVLGATPGITDHSDSEPTHE